MDDTLAGGRWQLDPETRNALRIEAAHQAMTRNDWFLASTELEELLDEEPGHPEALALLADATLSQGDAVLASAIYEHALRVGGTIDPGMLSGLALARFESCSLVGAAEAAREAVRLEPGLAEAWNTLGLTLSWLGPPEESSAALLKAHRLAPDHFPFGLNLTEGQWAEAVAEATARIAPSLMAFFYGIPIHLEDRPALDELRVHDPPLPPTTVCLAIGEPPLDGNPWIERPEGFRLFRANLARSYDFEDLVGWIVQGLEDEAFAWLDITAPEPITKEG